MIHCTCHLEGVQIHSRLSTDLEPGGKEMMQDDKQVRLFPSYRLLVAVIGHLAVLCSYMCQDILAASLLTMTDGFANNGTSNASEASETYDASVLLWRYDWDESTQSYIISSFFASYYVMQFPVGWLIQRFGAKRVVLVSAVASAIVQAVAVVTAVGGQYFFIVAMAAMGLASGSMFSPVMALVARWCPPQESSRLTSVSLAGFGNGIALMYAVSAVTNKIQFVGGWPLNFVILGIILLLVSILWAVFVTDSADTNKWISTEERLFIQRSFAVHGHKTVDRRTTIPWCQILTSGPVWAVIASQIGVDWIRYCMMTSLRTYFSGVRHMDTASVDMLVGLPWAGVIIAAYIASKLIDGLRARGMSTSRLRKLSDILGKPVPALLLLLMSFLPDSHDTSQSAVILVYTLSVFLAAGFEGSGYVANISELSPAYAGVIWSISQTFAATCSFIAPLVLTAMTPNNTMEEWRGCFLLTLAVEVLTSLVYVILASSQPQHWVGAEHTLILPEEKIPIYQENSADEQQNNSIGKNFKDAG